MRHTTIATTYILVFIWSFSTRASEVPFVESDELVTQQFSTTDKESNVSGSIHFLEDVAGGVYGFTLSLHKGPDSHDVVLKINDELSSFVMVNITDEAGNVLSKSPRRMTTDTMDPENKQSFSYIRLSQTSNHEWFVPISSYLTDISELDFQEMQNVRIVINVTFNFSLVGAHKLVPEQNFASALLTFYDVEAHLTKEALKGDAATKYESHKTKLTQGVTENHP